MQLAELEDGRTGEAGQLLAPKGATETVKEAEFSLRMPRQTPLAGTSAHTLSRTWLQAIKTYARLSGEWTQGPLARWREVKVGAGNSFAKS